jgi:hypothetical protein
MKDDGDDVQGKLDLSRALRDDGMQRAADHAEAVIPEWKELAYTRLLEFLGYHMGEFFSEDVRAFATGRGLPRPPDNRAWGHVMMRAARAGIIRKLRWDTAKDQKVHCNPVSVWIRA